MEIQLHTAHNDSGARTRSVHRTPEEREVAHGSREHGTETTLLPDACAEKIDTETNPRHQSSVARSIELDQRFLRRKTDPMKDVA